MLEVEEREKALMKGYAYIEKQIKAFPHRREEIMKNVSTLVQSVLQSTVHLNFSDEFSSSIEGVDKLAERYLAKAESVFTRFPVWSAERLRTMMLFASELRTVKSQQDKLQSLWSQVCSFEYSDDKDYKDEMMKLKRRLTTFERLDQFKQLFKAKDQKTIFHITRYFSEDIDEIREQKRRHDSLTADPENFLSVKNDALECLLKQILDEISTSWNLTLASHLARFIFHACETTEIADDEGSSQEAQLGKLALIFVEAVLEFDLRPESLCSPIRSLYTERLAQVVAADNGWRLFDSWWSTMEANVDSYPLTEDIGQILLAKIKKFCTKLKLPLSHPTRLRFIRRGIYHLEELEERCSEMEILNSEIESDKEAGDMEEAVRERRENRLRCFQRDRYAWKASLARQEGRLEDSLRIWIHIHEKNYALFFNERLELLEACKPLHQQLDSAKLDDLTPEEVRTYSDLAIRLLDHFLEVAEASELAEALAHRWSNDFALKRIGKWAFKSWNEQALFYIRKTREIFERFPSLPPECVNTVRLFIHKLEDPAVKLQQALELLEELEEGARNGMVDQNELRFEYHKLKFEAEYFAASEHLIKNHTETKELFLWYNIAKMNCDLSSWEATAARRVAKHLKELLQPAIYAACPLDIVHLHLLLAAEVCHFLLINECVSDMDELLDRLWRINSQLQKQGFIPRLKLHDDKIEIDKEVKRLEVPYDLALYHMLYAERVYCEHAYTIIHPARIQGLLRFFWRLQPFSKRQAIQKLIRSVEVIERDLLKVDEEVWFLLDEAMNSYENRDHTMSFIRKDYDAGEYVHALTQIDELLKTDAHFSEDELHLVRSICQPLLNRSKTDKPAMYTDAEVIEHSQLAISVIDRILEQAEVTELQTLLRYRWENDEQLATLTSFSSPNPEEYLKLARDSFCRYPAHHPLKEATLRHYVELLEPEPRKLELEKDIDNSKMEKKWDIAFHRGREHSSPSIRAFTPTANLTARSKMDWKRLLLEAFAWGFPGFEPS